MENVCAQPELLGREKTSDVFPFWCFQERNDDIRLRMKRAVRADPLYAPDEPIVVHFRSWEDPKARTMNPHSTASCPDMTLDRLCDDLDRKTMHRLMTGHEYHKVDSSSRTHDRSGG